MAEGKNDLLQQKKLLRKRLLTQRDGLSIADRKEAAGRLAERILGHPWFESSDVVLGFASYGSEIETDGILKEVLRQGKTLYLPRVEGEEMFFYRVRELTELKVGYKGIREPDEDAEAFVYEPSEKERVFMLVPGVAFDREGNRMGYGKGFYDRFLADKPELQKKTVGVGYACQMVEEVPGGEQDIRISQVICI